MREVLVGQALVLPPRVRRRGKVAQDVLVEEMGEGSVPNVVEKSGQPQRLDDQALGGCPHRRLDLGQRGAQTRVEVARPQAGLVHDAQTVC